jgi:hypothetical protein
MALEGLYYLPKNGLRKVMLRAYVVISYDVIGLPFVTEI